MFKKLIFVSTANTCRSAMAAAIYKSVDVSSDMEVTSRGIVVLFEEPVNAKAETVLNNHELSISEHKSSQLVPQDADNDTLILTMNEKQKNCVINDIGIHENVYTITEFADDYSSLSDPYGGDLAEYEKCYQELVRVIKKVVYKLSDNTTNV